MEFGRERRFASGRGKFGEPEPERRSQLVEGDDLPAGQRLVQPVAECESGRDSRRLDVESRTAHGLAHGYGRRPHRRRRSTKIHQALFVRGRVTERPVLVGRLIEPLDQRRTAQLVAEQVFHHGEAPGHHRGGERRSVRRPDAPGSFLPVDLSEDRHPYGLARRRDAPVGRDSAAVGERRDLRVSIRVAVLAHRYDGDGVSAEFRDPHGQTREDLDRYGVNRPIHWIQRIQRTADTIVTARRAGIPCAFPAAQTRIFLSVTPVCAMAAIESEKLARRSCSA